MSPSHQLQFGSVWRSVPILDKLTFLPVQLSGTLRNVNSQSLNSIKANCDVTGGDKWNSPRPKVQAAIMSISHRATKKLQFYVIVILPRELNYNPQFKHVILQEDIWDFLARHCYTRLLWSLLAPF